MNRNHELVTAMSLLNSFADEFPGIERTPGVCGGAARVAGTRIPVWVLVDYRKLGATDAELLRAYPTLRAEDLTHAWNYYRTNMQQIEQEISENEAA